MKLISLNIWGGTMLEPLLEFIKKQSADTDIFCFQEVFRGESDAVSNGMRMNIFSTIATALPDHDAYFTPVFENYDFAKKVDFPVICGQAIFIKNTIPVVTHGNFFIYGSYNDVMIHEDGKPEFPEALQYVQITHDNKPLTIAHIHGVVWPGSKLDSPARLEQSRHIIEFLEKQSGEKILCGDFNLMPDTESIHMIEQSGMKNLITEYKIADTRGSFNRSRFPNDPQFFADYCFVSTGISIQKFSVPDLPISDHLPLILEF